MINYSTGNDKVDAMVSMQLTGNVTPHVWYKTITRENGKPHLLAISILSDIVYWYRPEEIRDETTGHFIGYKKKFKSDLLQRSYSQWADFFGESERSIKAAILVLEELGIIKREFRTVEIGGTPFNNIMFIDLDPEKLYQITFPESHDEKQECQPCSKITPPLRQNFVRGVAKECQRGDKTLSEGQQKNVTRNTENTTENTQRALSSSSDNASGNSDDDEERIKERINYNGARKKYPQDLVEAVYRGICRNRDKFLEQDFSPDLFEHLCGKIIEFSKNVSNRDAYINACINNMLRGKIAAQARGNELKKSHSGKFGFEEHDYDFSLLEQDILSN